MTIRIFPAPTPTTTDAEKVDALWRMAVDASAAVPAVFGAGYSWIALDPGLSAPNALIGLVIPGAGRPVALTPGRVFPLDPTQDRVLVYNAFQAIMGRTGFVAGSGQVGRATLVVGRAADLGAYLAGLESNDPTPKASLIGATVGNLGFTVCSANLRKLRLHAWGTSAAGSIVDPGDFAVTLTPKIAMLGSALAFNPLAGGANGDLLDNNPLGPNGFAYSIDTAAAVTFSPSQHTRVIDVTPGLAVQLSMSLLAGTGVVNAYVAVEGIR